MYTDNTNKFKANKLRELTDNKLNIPGMVLGSIHGAGMGYVGNTLVNLIDLTAKTTEAALAVKLRDVAKANKIAEGLFPTYKEAIMEAIRTDIPQKTKTRKFFSAIAKSPLKTKSRLALLAGIPAVLGGYMGAKL